MSIVLGRDYIIEHEGCRAVIKISEFVRKRPKILVNASVSLRERTDECIETTSSHDVSSLFCSHHVIYLYEFPIEDFNVEAAKRCIVCEEFVLDDSQHLYCFNSILGVMKKYDNPSRDEAIDYMCGGLVEEDDRELLSKLIMSRTLKLPEYYMTDWSVDEEGKEE